MAQRVRARTAPDGLVIVDKPAGMTSHDVVARVRRLLGTRKVGHAGTLDPMATGVLVVGVERATRILGHLALTDKTYLATIRLGVSTVTDDAEGEVLSETDARGISDEDVRAGVRALTGTLRQRPSSVSAIKVDGVRSYTRVRSGEVVELAARTVTVSSFQVLDLRHSAAIVDVDVVVECSSGTYVRALARDLGAGLGVGGHLTALRRTRVGSFTSELSVTLDELATNPRVMPAVDAVRSQFGTMTVDVDQARRILHGAALPVREVAGAADAPEIAGPVGLVDPEGVLVSLAQARDEVFAPLVVFS